MNVRTNHLIKNLAIETPNSRSLEITTELAKQNLFEEIFAVKHSRFN